jgi:hypothetical protein
VKWWKRMERGQTQGMLGFEDTDEFRMGRAGECAAKAILTAHLGGWILEVCQVRGGDGVAAPMLQGEETQETEGRIVAPDLYHSVGGRTAAYEVKTKKRCHFQRNEWDPIERRTGRKEHGIDARHWRSYLSHEKETGIPTHLLIIELDTGEVLVAPVARLADQRVHRIRYGPMKHPKTGLCDGAMANFARAAFDSLGNFRDFPGVAEALRDSVAGTDRSKLFVGAV